MVLTGLILQCTNLTKVRQLYVHIDRKYHVFKVHCLFKNRMKDYAGSIATERRGKQG